MLPSPTTSAAGAGLSTYPSTFNSQSFLPQNQNPQDHSLHLGTDPNSPDSFRQNIRFVHETVGRLQMSARSALQGIQNAYHPGNSPAQTEAHLAALKQTLRVVSDMMRTSGVGALPLLPMPMSDADTPSLPPSEQHMLAEANRSIQVLYERLKRSQDSAAVVANLLGTPDRGR